MPKATKRFLADGLAEVLDLFMATRDTEFPNFELYDQVALVTGAARGLGCAISLALAHAGADVALGLRDVSTADSLQRDFFLLSLEEWRPLESRQVRSREPGGRA